MLSIFPPKMFDLVWLALSGIKEGENAANLSQENVWLYSIINFGKMLSIFPQNFLILLDLYFWGLRKGKMLPIFLKKMFGSIRFINFGFTMLSILPTNFLLLFDLHFGGVRKGKMLPIFSQENVGSIRFINFGFTMLSILASHKCTCNRCSRKATQSISKMGVVMPWNKTNHWTRVTCGWWISVLQHDMPQTISSLQEFAPSWLVNASQQKSVETRCNPGFDNPTTLTIDHNVNFRTMDWSTTITTMKAFSEDFR